MSKPLVIAGLLSLASSSVLTQELPLTADFYFCANYYRWADGRIKPEAPSKQHVVNSLKLFETGASILSGGAIDFDRYETSTAAFSAALKKASDEKKSVGEFVAEIDADCWAKQRRHTMAILEKSAEIGQAQRVFFSHNLPSGKVDSEAIERHQQLVRTLPGVSIDEQKEVTVYSLSKQYGERSESANHVFTKPNHPAHPAVIFMAKRRDAKDKPAVLSINGSYAGSKKEFDVMHTVLFMMNQGL
jgi:hypothetical protein